MCFFPAHLLTTPFLSLYLLLLMHCAGCARCCLSKHLAVTLSLSAAVLMAKGTHLLAAFA
jgi:hypothetical protein